MKQTSEVTLESLVLEALAKCDSNEGRAAEDYILMRVSKDQALLEVFLPAIREAIGNQIISWATAPRGNTDHKLSIVTDKEQE